MIETVTYQFTEDVYRKENKTRGIVQLIKLSGKDVFFEADLIAGEILLLIDGKKSVEVILQEISSSYEKEHEQEIRSRGLELFQKLESEFLITKTSLSSIDK